MTAADTRLYGSNVARSQRWSPTAYIERRNTRIHIYICTHISNIMSSFHPSNGIFLFEDWKLPICVAFRFGLARDFKWNQEIAPYICLHLIICPHQEFRVGKCLPWRIVIMLFNRWVRKAPDRFSEIHYDQNPFARGAKVWSNFLKKWVRGLFRTLVIDQNVPINVSMQHGRKTSKQGYLKSIGHCRADWLAPSSAMYIYIDG